MAKANRKKLQLYHTTGSVSYACSEHNLAMKLGHPPRRDETFIKTHTKKNGVPSTQAQPIIDEIKEIAEVYPELKERTIKEGDIFAVVCGEKEPKGYIRVMGLGPTQDVGTPGLKCYVPTRLQMEIFARMKAESDKAALEQRVLELQVQMEQKTQGRQSEEPMSQHDSTCRQPLNSRLDNIGDDGQEDVREEDYVSADECYDDDDQILSHHMHGAYSSRLATPITTAPRTNDDAPRSEHDALVGKKVILYALLRSDQPVGKGTIISTKPSTVLGNQPLGKEFCEVVVTCVLKRDAILPRPYADMETMADAKMMSIAWPYNKLRISGKKALTPTSGNSRR